MSEADRLRPVASALVGNTLQEAAELAYGLLWTAPTDRRDRVGLLASDARIALGNALGMDGKARGIERARNYPPRPAGWGEGGKGHE